MMFFISAFRAKLSSPIVGFNAQDHQGGWLSKYTAALVVGVAVATFIWKHARIRSHLWKEHSRIYDFHEVSTVEEGRTSDNFELYCSCGLPAKLRASRTLRNPYRLFYNCPKNVYHHQCEYFQWSDELAASLERSRREMLFFRDECIRLHKKIAYIQSQRENDRALWVQEKSELRSKVSSVQAELDDIKKSVQHLYDSDNMPPVDENYDMNEANDGAIDIEII